MRLWFSLLGLIPLFMLTGCAVKAPDIQYFLLSEPTFEAVEITALEDTPKVQVAIGSVSVADFLAGSGLVVEQVNFGLTKTNQHRWAERLDQQIARQVRTGLNQRYPQIQWIPLAHAGNVRLMDYRLDFQLDSFHLTAQHEAKVRIHWFLRTTQDKVVYSGTVEQQQALSRTGYTEAVYQLNQAWHQALETLTQEVVKHIQ